MTSEHEPLDAGGLSPVLVEGLHDQLDARRERHELVGPRADRRLLEALVADLLHVLLGHDPAGPGGPGVEGHEIRPRLLEPEADVTGIGRLHRHDPLLERLARGAAVALEGELHVLGGDGVAVVKAHPLAQDELVGEPVLRHRPGLGEGGASGLPGQGLHHGVVQRVVDHEGRDDPRGLRRIEPCRREGDVHAPGDLAFGPSGDGRTRCPGRESEGEQQSRKTEGESGSMDHGARLLVGSGICDRGDVRASLVPGPPRSGGTHQVSRHGRVLLIREEVSKVPEA